ncbi:MAG: ABA4-like family protein [Kibdelosporangium sp.]
MSQLFQLSFYLAAPFWALMILAPGWSWTRRIIGSPWIAAPVSVLYLAIAIPRLADLLPVVTQPTLAGLQEAMADGGMTTLVWAHIIAFDLFVGRWIYLRGRERRIHPLVTSPILLVTILLAPIGFLVFLAVRATATSTKEESPAHVGSRP